MISQDWWTKKHQQLLNRPPPPYGNSVKTTTATDRQPEQRYSKRLPFHWLLVTKLFVIFTVHEDKPYYSINVFIQNSLSISFCSEVGGRLANHRFFFSLEYDKPVNDLKNLGWRPSLKPYVNGYFFRATGIFEFPGLTQINLLVKY